MKLKNYIKNFFFCLKYPFWKSRNVWTGKFCGYSSTFYDWLPDGWRKAFGKELSRDIKKAGKLSRKRLKKHLSWKNMLSWHDIKSKYGSLRLSAAATEEIQDVLRRYEILSIGYCEICGKPARYVTSGWIEYLCEDCFKSRLSPDVVNCDQSLNQKLKDQRLTIDDIPKIYEYKNGESCNIDIKAQYNIDFEDLWGLK